MSKLITNIISVCKREKLGLMDLAEALTYYGNTNDSSRKYFILKSFFHIFIYTLKNRSRNIFVFWDNSVSTLSVMLICFIFRMKIIYYLHEPGGFKHKRQLRATFFYSLFATLNEHVCILLSTYVGISMRRNLEYGDYFLPLLYDERRPKHCPKKIIGFVGSQKKERMPDVFKSVAIGLKSFGYQISYFPSLEHGSSRKKKFEFLSKCSAVWNVFAYKYNLSGVTGDSFMSGVPIIVSKYEPHIKFLFRNDLAIKVNINDSSDKIIKKIIKYLNTQKNMTRQKKLQNDQSIFGGSRAFINYWKIAFDNIEGITKK
jgi:hypothetical protein